MLANPFKKYIFYDLICVVLVILTFKVVANKNLAGFITSAFFILTQFIILKQEHTRLKVGINDQRFKKWSLTQLGCVLFLVFGVFPILSVRLIHPMDDFQTLSFLGIPLELFHKVGNFLYLTKLVFEIYEGRKLKVD